MTLLYVIVARVTLSTVCDCRVTLLYVIVTWVTQNAVCDRRVTLLYVIVTWVAALYVIAGDTAACDCNLGDRALYQCM